MALRRKLRAWKSMTKKNHMKAIDLSFLGKEGRGGEGGRGGEEKERRGRRAGRKKG